MQVSAELQFKHVCAREPQLPASALLELETSELDAALGCCDLVHHVYNAAHTDPRLARALHASHWFSLEEWVARSGRGRSGAGRL
jgi:hypothetical protein